MAATERDTERTQVKVYVPAYQREEWDEHADELDMNRSEFVKSMVQAGRRGFEPYPSEASSQSEQADDGSTPDTEQPKRADSDDVEEAETNANFESTVLSLVESEPQSWDDLFDALTDDVEERLEEALQGLQESNRIRYSGPEGGYVRVE